MRSRRGLSSVVGMVFAIVAIVSTVGYVTYSLSTLDQYNQATLARNQQSIDAGKEGLQIYSANIVNGKFNITAANTGNLPINVTRIWVQNTTATDWTNVYSINKMVNPGNLLTNIGQNSPLGANPSYAYNIKLVTGRGNSLQFSVGTPAVKPLFLQAMFVPVSIKPAYNATLILQVTNNMTSNNLITNLQPQAPVCSGTMSTWTLKAGPLPAQYPLLAGGSTATFRWIYLTGGSAPAKETCTISLANGLAGNTGTDTVYFPNNP